MENCFHEHYYITAGPAPAAVSAQGGAVARARAAVKFTNWARIRRITTRVNRLEPAWTLHTDHGPAHMFACMPHHHSPVQALPPKQWL